MILDYFRGLFWLKGPPNPPKWPKIPVKSILYFILADNMELLWSWVDSITKTTILADFGLFLDYFELWDLPWPPKWPKKHAMSIIKCNIGMNAEKIGFGGSQRPRNSQKKQFLAWLHYGRVNFLGPNGRIFQLNILKSIGPCSIKIVVRSNNTFFILYSRSGQLWSA